MYIQSPKEAANFARALRRKARAFSGVEAVIAPAYPLIPAVAEALKGSSVHTGAQTLSVFDDGAHTGFVSAHMLKEAGATYVLVGHSERRAEGETDEMIRTELGHASVAGLTPVLCVGESERNAEGSHFGVIEKQLSSALQGIPGSALKLIVAYEPVWAIGKSASDSIDVQALTEVVIFIRKTLTENIDRKAALKVPILYGGSVEPQNAGNLIKESGVSGFLVGHASTELDSFVEILKAVRPARNHARN